MSGDFTIIRDDGLTFNLSDYNFTLGSYSIDPPDAQHFWDDNPYRDGLIPMGTVLKSRKISIKGYILAFDHWDFHLLRNEIYRLFDSRIAFYIVSSYEPGKRFYVKTENIKMEQQAGKFGTLEIDLIALNPYAESIGTTLDPVTFDAEVWQTGTGQTLDENDYTHIMSTFSIYNAADGVTIDPRMLPLTITFSGASTNLNIINETTGDEWAYTGTTTLGDTIKLDGVRSTKNNLSIFSNTNRKLIRLQPGNNDFTIQGASGVYNISFAFRFYTL